MEELGSREQYVQKRLESLEAHMEELSQTMIGYPVTPAADAREWAGLQPLLRFHINNCGDPTEDSGTFQNHAHAFERDVLEWFAALWGMRRSERDSWGYTTSGGTEGNLYATYIARELLPDGILYSSDQAHYSVPKAARICRIDMVKVASHESGELDCEELGKHLVANRGRPAIIVLNVGTTMKGAVDDIDCVLKVLEESGYGRQDFFIHCDAALSGLTLPFVRPGFLSFAKPIGSISVSGHKFLGLPMPCGVVMTRKSLVEKVGETVEYIGMHDTTLTGSRNGVAAVALWTKIAKEGQSGLQREVENCFQMARELKAMLDEEGWPAHLSDYSTTVTFRSPTDPQIIRKWSLACEAGTSHIVVMTHCTREKLQRFVRELLESERHPSGDEDEGEVDGSPVVPHKSILGARSHRNALLVEEENSPVRLNSWLQQPATAV